MSDRLPSSSPSPPTGSRCSSSASRPNSSRSRGRSSISCPTVRGRGGRSAAAARARRHPGRLSTAGWSCLRDADLIVVPGWRDLDETPRPKSRSALREAVEARRARRLDLLRRVSARPCRPARRPPRDHALAPHRTARAAVSERPRRARRALCRRGQRDDLGRLGRRHRHAAASGAQGLRPAHREHVRAPHGGAAASRRRAVAIRRAADRGAHQRPHRERRRLDGGQLERGDHHRGAGRPRRDERAHLHAPLPRRDRHRTDRMADPVARAPRAGPARDHRRADRSRRARGGLRRAGNLAPSFPPRGRHDAVGVAQFVSRQGRTAAKTKPAPQGRRFKSAWREPIRSSR